MGRSTMMQTAVVVGLGLIGGSLAKDLRRLNLAQQIIGVDTDPQHQKVSLELGLVDQIKEIFSDSVLSADLIVLAVPVHGIAKLLPEILQRASEQTTVIDMGSTKAQIVQTVQQHPRRVQYVAAHPMTGTEFSGPKAAVENLFNSKTVVLCDVEYSGVSHLEKVKSLFIHLKSRLVYMSAEDHDLHVSYVSHLSHVSSFVLALTVLAKEKNEKAIFDLAAGGFESTVRLAKSAPSMWAPIFAQNKKHVIEAIEAYMLQLQSFKKMIETEDQAGLLTTMKEANNIRRVLSEMRKL